MKFGDGDKSALGLLAAIAVIWAPVLWRVLWG